MKQEAFERHHAAEWTAFAKWLEWQRVPRRLRKAGSPPLPAQEIPQRYRHLCQHLAIARERGYGHALVERLHTLALDGHDLLYRSEHSPLRHALQYAAWGFARDVRTHRYWVLAAALLLFGPMLAAMLAVHLQPDLAYLVMKPYEVSSFEQMYAEGAVPLGRIAREASSDLEMFGFYIFNNIGIAFRCFAGGLTAGLLSIFALVFNGLTLGAVEMRVIQAGHGLNFYSFVIGHSGFEIGAILLAGATGLRLGLSIVAPGALPRGAALRRSAREVAGIVCGLTAMLVLAALIEAFWSPLRLEPTIKLGVGGVLCALPLLYFLLAGRRHGS